MPRHALLAAVSLVTLTACDPGMSTPTSPPAPTQQTWLCGREYENHAWGYQRFGSVLDTAGNIWSYKIDRAPAGQARRWDPRDMTMLTEADLKMRYEGAMTTGAKVPADEIARHTKLIEDAANGTPTTPKSVGADMGQHLLYCYTYDAAKRTYSQVMLDNRGDWDSTNPSPAAKALGAWLDKHLASTRVP